MLFSPLIRPRYSLHFLLVPAAFAAATCGAQTPEWIWTEKPAERGEVRHFRHAFTADQKPTKAELSASCDDQMELYFNGKKVATSPAWQQPVKVDVTAEVKAGENVIAARGKNSGGSAAFVAQLELTAPDKKKTLIVTGPDWLVSAAEPKAGWQSPGFDTSGWAKSKSMGKLGGGPWGDVFATGGKPAKGKASAKREATPAEMLHTLPGFKVELIHTAEPEEGSWVAMTRDDQGRLILSPQYPQTNPEGGLLRITLAPDGKIAKRELIARPLYDAQGLLFAHGAIYAVVNKYTSKLESGLYRLRDKGNDQFDDIELIKKLPGSGEHGPHSVELGPDGRIYVICGNHTKLPEGIAPDSPHRNYQEDHLLPRQWDGNGHATGILAPGGHVLRTDPDGKKWELFCAGFRNPYGIAFNGDGELFTFDSDMEWDWGMPWYRPTRVNHCVSGGESGWRSGTGKWPAYYADSLPPVVDIGIGSPTAVRFGTGAKFPVKYQRALYILDWTYGRLMAVHLTPDGASYKGTFENFVCPLGLAEPGKEKRPLNVTNLVIGKDGAMYFTIGGRGTQAGLYRVTYTGGESTAPVTLTDTAGAEARKLRRQLEAFHGHEDPKAVGFLWPHLDSNDRFIRYAARIALEAQPVAPWRDRAIAETRTNAGLTALLALARVGGRDTQADLLNALKKFPLSSLSEAQQLDKLRVIELSFIRQGRPAPELARVGIEKLDAIYPGKSEFLNRELSQLLIYLEAPDAVAKTLTLMAVAPTQEELMHYLFHLRTAKNWTPQQRAEYFKYFGRIIAASRNAEFFEPDYPGTVAAPKPISRDHPAYLLKWFEAAGRPYGDGASFANFLKNFFNEAVANLSASEKDQLQPLLASVEPAGRAGKKSPSAFPEPKQRNLVKEWTLAELLPDLDKVSAGRDLGKGRQAFADAQCLVCHRFGNEGGGVGPDLTAVATRFSPRDILESIIEPSKVVSEQFQNSTLTLKDGTEITGRVVDDTAERLVLIINPLSQERMDVKKTDIQSRAASPISPMPDGLVNVLSKDEILDLVSLLESAGRAQKR